MRILKKSIAMLIAVAMVLSLVSVGVFADEAELTIVLEANKAKVGSSGTFDLSVYLVADHQVALSMDGGTFRYDTSKITLEDKSAADLHWAGGSFVGGAVNGFSFGSMVPYTVPAGKTLVATISVKLTDADAFDIAVADDSAFTDTAYGSVDWAAQVCDVQVVEAFDITGVNAVEDQTFGIGTTLEQVTSALPTTVTVTGDGNKSTTLTANNWGSANFVQDSKGEYTFTADLVDDDGIFETDKKATVKVVIGAIDLATEGKVTSEYPAIKYQLVGADADVKSVTPAQVLADTTKLTAAYKTASISRNDDKYPESEATVTWAAAADSAATLDLTKLTSDVSTNVLKLTGTVTPKADGNYSGTTTVSVDVIVVPAEVKGGSVALSGSAATSRPVSVTVVIPDGEYAEGDTITLTIYKKDVETPAGTKAYTITADDVKEDEPFRKTVSFDDSLKAMGFVSGDKFTVVADINGAKILVDGESAELDVEGTVKEVSSGGSSNPLPSGGTVVEAKTYAVEVTESENGTFTVNPTKAKSGETVTVTTSPAEGYKTDVITVVASNGAEVEVNQATKTFTMPALSVKVSVKFVEGAEVTPVVAGPFPDVAADKWSASYIDTLKAAGIVGGDANGNFNPEAAITRAEYAKMIVNAFGIAESANESVFVDCPAGEWFTPFVVAAAEAGYILGVSENEFAPNDPITREQAFTILGRAIGLSGNAADMTGYTDAAAISEYAVPYVSMLVTMGVVNGYEDGAIRPAAQISREEAAKIIAVVYQSGKVNVNVDEDVNADDVNADDVNADDVNADDVNADDVNADDVNADDVNADDVNADDVNADDVNADDAE